MSSNRGGLLYVYLKQHHMAGLSNLALCRGVLPLAFFFSA